MKKRVSVCREERLTGSPEVAESVRDGRAWLVRCAQAPSLVGLGRFVGRVKVGAGCDAIAGLSEGDNVNV